jgi:hypothetical protein
MKTEKKLTIFLIASLLVAFGVMAPQASFAENDEIVGDEMVEEEMGFASKESSDFLYDDYEEGESDEDEYGWYEPEDALDDEAMDDEMIDEVEDEEMNGEELL